MFFPNIFFCVFPGGEFVMQGARGLYKASKGRFDVHTDTIIRTKESLKLKAVFLDETEVLNNQECANLCCDTENCDVFIFEEKVKGTCFLFQCGPPEDFRCKFTRHANYTSAVMSPMRQPEQQTSPPLAHPAVPSVGLSQHEMELVSLKSGKGLRNDEISAANSSQGIKNATPVEQTTPKSSTCSRFQFACHSGECLAVYNACDGIPQCEDGSDEGPECPKQPSAGGGQQNSQNGQQMQDLSNTVRLLPSDSGNEGNNAPQMTMQRQYQIHNREDPMTAPKQWPQMNPMFLDGDSRIFNHKGGIQVPASSMSGPGYQMVPPQDAFMRPQMGDMYSRGQIQSQQQSWLPEHYQGKIPGNPMEWNQQPVDQSTMVQQSPALLAPQIPQLPQPPQLTATQVELQQQRPDWPIVPLMPVQPGKNHPNENVKKPIKVGGSTKAEESGEVLGNEYQDESDDEAEMRITTAAPRKKNRKHKKPKEGSKDNISKAKDADKPLHEQLKMIHNDLEMEFVDHDGEAERPSGAVLSLTLGIIIMAALAVLVGCRMKVVGRRMRRGGKSQYAHDADFLVNGMYL
ncbi:uncharacterized protein LOC129789347 isoform X2 [Lutzomyia longipalpis]|uniref:uncharacterized protein LOC129789347 isoform X2 n=1 Tax=Lutzomyia longipalpis TaxID=7200 RepID=UPI00248417F7|nr:uncharacterized protein LOC129789347 isoform X2 [Lutzomyia longipalpis]